MPVQVLPYVQSPLEQLMPHINQAIGQVGQGVGQHYRNKADASILEQLRSGNVSPINQPTLWAKLSPEARKAYEPFIASDLRKQEAEYKEGIKRETEDIEKGQKSQAVIDTAKKMRDLIQYTGSTRIPFTKSAGARPDSFVNREGLQKRNKFDTLAASAASFFRDLDTKGQLPQGLYESVIKPRLPNSELSERENMGRIEGLEELAQTYGGKAFKQTEEKKTEGKGKKITEDIVKGLLKENNNDPEKARAAAKELGYEF